MDVPDPRLSLSAFGLNTPSNSKGSESFGYQQFENAGVEDELGQGDFPRNQQLRFDQLDLDPEAGKTNFDDQPRNRRANGLGGKGPFGNGRSIGAAGDDDEVEECQIRTYGGPLSRQDLREGLRSFCSLNTLMRRFPISMWLPHYTLMDLSGDLVAGLTVGLTVVPQALAYAQIADLPLEYGLYSAFMAPFIYAVFGTSKDVTVGPTALLSLLTSAFIPHRTADAHVAATYAVLLAFFCGCFQLLMGILNLGFLMNFVSSPVMSGFMSAASILIILGQVKGLLGINFGRSRNNLFNIIRGYSHHVHETNGWDVLLGAICIGSILVLKALAPLLKHNRFRNKQANFGWKLLREIVKIFCYGRYALVVIIATVVAASLTSIDGSGPLTITHEVKSGLPAFVPPVFTPDNKTFMEVVDGCGAGLVLIPIIGLFESIVVAKAFSHRFGYTVDSTQEFIALGISNILGSFVSAFPVTGAFSRTALNAESGVRTPLGGIFTGAFVLIAMSVLSPVLQYIPKAALSAVIISAIFVMVDVKIFRDLWRVNRVELIPLLSTLILCLLLGVEYGLPLGIGISLLMLVYPLARPLVTVEYRRAYKREMGSGPSSGPKAKPKFNVTVTPHSALYFPSAEFFKDIFAKDLLNPGAFRYGVSAAPDFMVDSLLDDIDLVEERKNAPPDEKFPPIVFNGVHLTNADYSTVRTMRNIVASCHAARRDIVFTNTAAAGQANLHPSSGYGINSHDFMRLVQTKEEDVQMENLTTVNDPAAFTSSITGLHDNKSSLEKERVAISATGQTATYSAVEFPNPNADSTNLHLHT
ncbi:Sodium-independent sulfate anion transporter [Hypsibius exemplaris]|uniref:Sodium-independent sulfate anion transporter n=1 Tax=Hypsibius exemplaris TaxID=2072580 RepID=A0A1W0X0Z4_HYPEX|nr:Sodium-independent sulfate anion transporter [Hypsibius exemplaris]